MRLVEPDIDVPDNISVVYLKNEDERVMYQMEYHEQWDALLLNETIPIEGEGNCHIHTTLEVETN